MKNEIPSNPFSNVPDIPRSKMTYFIICLIGFTQGVIELSHLSINYLLKDDYLLSPYELSLATGVTIVPWIIKPLWGFISDSFPILGYRRKTYLIFLSFFQFVIWIILSLWIYNVWLTIVFLFIIEFCIAFCNVIGEAILVEISRDSSSENGEKEEERQSTASHNVSLFFGIKYVGIFLTAYLSGFLLEYIDKRQIFLITSIFPLVLSFSSVFLSERKLLTKREKEAREIQEILSNHEEKEVLTHNEVIEDPKKKNCENCFRLWDFLKNKEIIKPIIFLLAFNSIPSIASPMFYFYTEALKFSPEFLGQLRVISALASVAAIFFYRIFLKLTKFKTIFCWTAILCMISQLLLLILITRYNLVLGIHDKVFSICDNLFIRMMAELNMIPVLVFACRICPKNVEGTMYALVMSTLNMGFFLSEQTGAICVYILGITTTDFTLLWLLIVIENLFIVVLLPFLYFLRIKEAQEIAEGKIEEKKEIKVNEERMREDKIDEKEEGSQKTEEEFEKKAV